MPYNIIIGRDEDDRRRFGENGVVFLGRTYVKMGQVTSLANNLFLDVVRPHVLLLTGKRGCLPGDHKIFTDKGYKKIEDFDGQKDKVLSFNKNELEFVWKNAKLLEYDVDKEDLIKLTLKDGREITITDEHPLLVFHKNAVLVWRKGKDLEEGDLLVNTTILPEIRNDKESLRIARLLGFTLADGNIFVQKGRWKDGRGYWYNGTKKRLRIDTDCEKVCLQAKKDIEEEFGVKARFGWRKDCNCGRVASTNSKVVDKLMNLGVPAGKKSEIIRMPPIVWESSNEFKANFINALFSCDGYVQNDGMRVEYYSNSKEFMKDLQLLLSHFSIEAVIRKKFRSDMPNYVSYRLGFSDYVSLINFRNKVGSFNKNKHEKLQLKKFHISKRRRCTKYIGDDLVCSRITRLEKVNGIKKVYDLHVPETNSFIANGIISHNSGKSYSISVIAEGMARLPKEVSENLSIILFDTMGIFWTMKSPNERQAGLLKEWGLKPEGMDVKIFTPAGFYETYKKKGIPTDYKFSIRASELSSGDWCDVLNISIIEPIGLLISRVIESLKSDYSVQDIINEIKKDKKAEEKVKDAAESRFLTLEKWGLFSKKGTKIKDLVIPGNVTIVDVSCYTEVSGGWSVKALVIGLIARKLLRERITIRKMEELNEIKYGTKYIGLEERKELPLVWVGIDEAHKVLSKFEKTPATGPLIQLLREGRQPGISLMLATQQPGVLHNDALTQSDVVISHRLTARQDIEALNNIMQTYLITDLQGYLNNLPKLKGSAIILDDNSERIYPMRIRPKMSWHGGEAPTAIKMGRETEL